MLVLYFVYGKAHVEIYKLNVFFKISLSLYNLRQCYSYFESKKSPGCHGNKCTTKCPQVAVFLLIHHFVTVHNFFEVFIIKCHENLFWWPFCRKNGFPVTIETSHMCKNTEKLCSMYQCIMYHNFLEFICSSFIFS